MSALRKISLGMRIGAIGLVAFSPWLKPTARPSMEQSIMYVVDNSGSIGNEDALRDANYFLVTAWGNRRPGRQSEKLGVIRFAKHAEVAASLGAGSPPEIKPAEATEAGASDLAGAIQLAAAALPAEGHRSIVVLSDFRPTRGDAEAEVRKAAEAGIRVDVVPLEGPKPTSPMVTAIHPRATHVAEHQPIAFDVDVSASGAFQIVWTRDGVALPPVKSWTYRRHNADDPAPENQDKTVELVDRDAPPGTHVYEAHAEELAGWGRRAVAVGDDAAKAASAITAVSVEGKAYAAVFSTGGDVPAVLAAALKEAGLEARRLPIERAADPSTYTGADLVVLSDVRVTAAEKDDGALTRAGQAALVEYVQQGGGLLTTGGVFGLAPEYAGTPLARAIPVEIEDRGHVEDPPVSLAIMLDRSGSMTAQVGGHTKLELALEASLGAAEVLRPTDFVALASVDTETSWDIPMGPQSRLPEYRDKVRTVQPGGGGIYVYTALKDAYKALEPQKTPIRHVILFSDTADSEQQTEDCPFDYDGACAKSGKTAEKLAREARAKGITTTVVGIGDESAHDTPFLRNLAAASGGRFYITEEGTDLRRIFLSETRVLAQSNLREKKVKVARASQHPALEGVDTGALPMLGAYVETGRRSGADTALVLPDGRPMLATWRYGLGKSGALTTDLIEGWGDDWAKSHVAQQVLRQSLRFLLRQSDARRADARVAIKDRAVEVDIELPPDSVAGSRLTAAPALMDVYAASPGGPSRKLDMKLEQRGPGHWVARGRSNGEPVIIARARDGRGALMAEAIGREDRAAEITGGGTDMYLATALARTGDGRISPLPVETLAWTSKPAKTLVATWPYALVGAAFLVMLDLLVRRISERKRTSVGAATRIDGVVRPEPLRAAA